MLTITDPTTGKTFDQSSPVQSCPCGALLVIAGHHPRITGTRPAVGGKVPSDGRSEWGRYVCHVCGSLITLPEDESGGIKG